MNRRHQLIMINALIIAITIHQNIQTTMCSASNVDGKPLMK